MKKNTADKLVRDWLKDDKGSIKYALKFLNKQLGEKDYLNFVRDLNHIFVDCIFNKEILPKDYIDSITRYLDTYCHREVEDKISDIIDNMPIEDVVNELKVR